MVLHRDERREVVGDRVVYGKSEYGSRMTVNSGQDAHSASGELDGVCVSRRLSSPQ